MHVVPQLDDYSQRILGEAKRTGLAITPDQAVRLVDLLTALNDGPGALTAIRGMDEGVSGHVMDSLVALLLPEVTSCRRIADVGSGSGFPGLALAVVLPHASVTLIESVQKKARWLSDTADRLVPNVDVRAQRSEDVAREHASAFDLVVARALAPPPVALELCAPLAEVGGHIVLWVGPNDSELDSRITLAAERLGLARCPSVAVEPFVGAKRRLMPFRKTDATPEGYPRRPGRANTHPIA